MRKIKIKDREIEYKIRRSRRAKNLRIAVYSDARVVVSLPWRMSESFAEKFIREKSSWILDKIFHFKKFGKTSLLRTGSRDDFLKNKKAASELAEERVKFYNRVYGFKYEKIAVKNQTTRWGSCSKKGNLNFNYRILFLPKPLADYLVVHELCHLKEFNHSKRFWDLVGKTIPEYNKIRKELKVL